MQVGEDDVQRTASNQAAPRHSLRRVKLEAVPDLQNEFTWSHSRARCFSQCPRAYWFTYYGSWGGWSDDAAAEVRDAYVQKKLTTIPMWTGTVVHGVAEAVLRAARTEAWVPGVDEAVGRAREGASRDIAGSANGSWLRRPAKRTGFAEHYYSQAVENSRWDAAIDEIERQVRSLYDNKYFRRLLQVPQRIRELEDLRRFRVGDTDVYVVIDVAVEDDRGGLVIIDWKTGDNHDDDNIAAQLGIYGLYSVRELGVAEDAITAMHVNLRHGTATRHAVDSAAMAKAASAVAESAAAMRAKLRDVGNNIADKDDFQVLPPGAEACRRCNFRRSCARENC